jgi:hypothetical protein
MMATMSSAGVRYATMVPLCRSSRTLLCALSATNWEPPLLSALT